jgi:hypothetical protein
VFTWYRWAGLSQPVLSLRAYAHGLKHLVPGPVLYSLPDALWVYSFTVLLKYIWAEYPNGHSKTTWPLLPVTLAVGAELGQAVKIVPGTFDVMDLLAYFGAWAAAFMVVRRSNQNHSARQEQTGSRA